VYGWVKQSVGPPTAVVPQAKLVQLNSEALKASTPHTILITATAINMIFAFFITMVLNGLQCAKTKCEFIGAQNLKRFHFVVGDGIASWFGEI
jgi:hypothetical protein